MVAAVGRDDATGGDSETDLCWSQVFKKRLNFENVDEASLDS